MMALGGWSGGGGGGNIRRLTGLQTYATVRCAAFLIADTMESVGISANNEIAQEWGEQVRQLQRTF